jgi:hypothetical protein
MYVQSLRWLQIYRFFKNYFYVLERSGTH